MFPYGFVFFLNRRPFFPSFAFDRTSPTITELEKLSFWQKRGEKFLIQGILIIFRFHTGFLLFQHKIKIYYQPFFIIRTQLVLAGHSKTPSSSRPHIEKCQKTPYKQNFLTLSCPAVNICIFLQGMMHILRFLSFEHMGKCMMICDL